MFTITVSVKPKGSNSKITAKRINLLSELADRQDLGSCAERREGPIPKTPAFVDICYLKSYFHETQGNRVTYLTTWVKG